MTGGKPKIIFVATDRQKADFKIRLQYDSLTQSQFLRSVIDGYISKDEDIINFIEKIKENLSAQNKRTIRKTKKDFDKMKKEKNRFALGDQEVENIFDILEKEHPDL